jgi:hypothetical protein
MSGTSSPRSQATNTKRKERKSQRFEVRVGPSQDTRTRTEATRLNLDASDFYRDGAELLLQLLEGNAHITISDARFIRHSPVITKAIAFGILPPEKQMLRGDEEGQMYELSVPTSLEEHLPGYAAQSSPASPFPALHIPHLSSGYSAVVDPTTPGNSQASSFEDLSDPQSTNRTYGHVPQASAATPTSVQQPYISVGATPDHSGTPATDPWMESASANYDMVQALLRDVRSSISCKFLDSLPKTHWKDAVEDGEWMSLPAAIAQELEASPGDVWVRVENQHMEKCDIAEGAIVLVRPLRKGRSLREGEIVVAEIEDANGDVHCALCRWFTTSDGAPTPRDSEDCAIEIPPDATAVPVAVYRGMMGRANF